MTHKKRYKKARHVLKTLYKKVKVFFVSLYKEFQKATPQQKFIIGGIVLSIVMVGIGIYVAGMNQDTRSQASEVEDQESFSLLSTDPIENVQVENVEGANQMRVTWNVNDPTKQHRIRVDDLTNDDWNPGEHDTDFSVIVEAGENEALIDIVLNHTYRLSVTEIPTDGSTEQADWIYGKMFVYSSDIDPIPVENVSVQVSPDGENAKLEVSWTNLEYNGIQLPYRIRFDNLSDGGWQTPRDSVSIMPPGSTNVSLLTNQGTEYRISVTGSYTYADGSIEPPVWLPETYVYPPDSDTTPTPTSDPTDGPDRPTVTPTSDPTDGPDRPTVTPTPDPTDGPNPTVTPTPSDDDTDPIENVEVENVEGANQMKVTWDLNDPAKQHRIRVDNLVNSSWNPGEHDSDYGVTVDPGTNQALIDVILNHAYRLSVTEIPTDGSTESPDWVEEIFIYSSLRRDFVDVPNVQFQEIDEENEILITWDSPEPAIDSVPPPIRVRVDNTTDDGGWRSNADSIYTLPPLTNQLVIPVTPATYRISVTELYNNRRVSGVGEIFGGSEPPDWEEPFEYPFGNRDCSRKSEGDANCDGDITIRDFEILRQELTATLAGETDDDDADGDGDVWDCDFNGESNSRGERVTIQDAEILRNSLSREISSRLLL